MFISFCRSVQWPHGIFTDIIMLLLHLLCEKEASQDAEYYGNYPLPKFLQTLCPLIRSDSNLMTSQERGPILANFERWGTFEVVLICHFILWYCFCLNFWCPHRAIMINWSFWLLGLIKCYNQQNQFLLNEVYSVTDISVEYLRGKFLLLKKVSYCIPHNILSSMASLMAGGFLWWLPLTSDVLLLCPCSRMARSRVSWGLWYLSSSSSSF